MILDDFNLAELFQLQEKFAKNGVLGVNAGNEMVFWDELLGQLEDTEASTADKKDYLSRDDKVLSLQRNKTSRVVTTVKQEGLFDMFQSGSIQSRKGDSAKLFLYLSGVIVKRVVKPALLELAGRLDDIEVPDCNEVLKPLFGSVMPEVGMEIDSTNRYIIKQFLKREDVSAVTLKVKGKSYVLVLNGKLKEKQRDCAWHLLRGNRDSRYFTDATGIAGSALYVAIDQVFQEHISSIDKEELQQNVVYRLMYDYMIGEISPHMAYGELLLSYEVHSRYPAIMEYLTEANIACTVLPHNISRSEVKERFGVNPLTEWEISIFAPFIPSIPRSPYATEGHYYNRRYRETYMKLFWLLYDEWNTLVQTRRYLRELSRSARVYETKRNIPDKYLSAMGNSKFNDYFKFVEIDADCDLDLVREIENEFIALKTDCFDEDKYDVEIRFRKLGRHRAAGLYFPSRSCLCVDIRYPSSLGHEYLHMFDSVQGRLSSKYDFYRIRNLYSDILYDFAYKLPAENKLRERLLGNTKYNLAYYLEPTEIFARCGELYFTQIMGVDNSLMKPEYNFAYPKDGELMSAIKDYYGNLFDKKTSSGFDKERREAG